MPGKPVCFRGSCPAAGHEGCACKPPKRQCCGEHPCCSLTQGEQTLADGCGLCPLPGVLTPSSEEVKEGEARRKPPPGQHGPLGTPGVGLARGFGGARWAGCWQRQPGAGFPIPTAHTQHSSPPVRGKDAPCQGREGSASPETPKAVSSSAKNNNYATQRDPTRSLYSRKTWSSSR